MTGTFEVIPAFLGIQKVANVADGGEVFPVNEPDASFILYRIGDAVASRNIDTAIYDAMRYGLRW